MRSMPDRPKKRISRQQSGTVFWQALLGPLLLVAIILCACGQNNALEEIQKAGAITVITRNNAHCYYTYRDQPMGFEYDLAKAFADFLGVELQINVAESYADQAPNGEFLKGVSSRPANDYFSQNKQSLKKPRPPGGNDSSRPGRNLL
jgi:ABC-type amino acid transport substrate-binding protein